MSFIFSVIAPVFLLMLLGYGMVRANYFPAQGVNALTRFVNNIAAPVLLFRSISSMEFSEAFRIEYVGPYYLTSFFIFFVGIFIARAVFKRRPGEAVAVAFSGCFINGLLIGLPLIQRAYGDEGMVLMLTVLGIHAPILYTVGMVTMELQRRDAQPLSRTFKIAAKNIVTQPIVIGILCGFLSNIVGFEMPNILDVTTEMLAGAVLPCALFGIGGVLVQYKLSSVWLQAAVFATMKLMVQPFILWLVLIKILDAPHDISRIFILLASMPAGVNTYIFATYYNRGVNVASNVLLISTAAGFFTISFWLWFLS
ncbi:MAG: AEC family transporter [Alphaproteobacteria bacterium]|nr:AEC family transporter [Alphaproteobacteria bacterium]